MGVSIDEIIALCTAEHTADIPADGRKLFSGFVRRQMKQHPEYTLEQRGITHPYCEELADKLTFFAYFMRQLPTADRRYGSEPFLVDTDEKLKALQKRTTADEWDDLALFRIYQRVSGRRQAHKDLSLQLYRELFDDAGADPEVVRLWGRALTYGRDVLGHGKNPPKKKDKETFEPVRHRSGNSHRR